MKKRNRASFMCLTHDFQGAGEQPAAANGGAKKRSATGGRMLLPPAMTEKP